jgi:hypothetical protein
VADREGAYRCEVSLDLRSPVLGIYHRWPWILSNPIYVGKRWMGDAAAYRE